MRRLAPLNGSPRPCMVAGTAGTPMGAVYKDKPKALPFPVTKPPLRGGFVTQDLSVKQSSCAWARDLTRLIYNRTVVFKFIRTLIGVADPTASLEIAMAEAEYFGLSPDEAKHTARAKSWRRPSQLSAEASLLISRSGERREPRREVCEPGERWHKKCGDYKRKNDNDSFCSSARNKFFQRFRN
jgi:hypothetical protein